MSLRALSFAFFACILFAPHSASAEYIPALSEKVVEKFVNETNAITAGSNIEDKERILEYLDTHIHTNARFNISVTLKMGSFPANNQKMSYDKGEYIQTTAQNLSDLSGFSSKAEILNLMISPKKDQAIIRTRTKEKANIPVTQPDGKVKVVPVSGLSECKQVLMLVDGTIQVFKADCDTNFEVEVEE